MAVWKQNFLLDFYHLLRKNNPRCYPIYLGNTVGTIGRSVIESALFFSSLVASLDLGGKFLHASQRSASANEEAHGLSFLLDTN